MFLSRAPLTFGHSQLVVPLEGIPASQFDAKGFKQAERGIELAINVFGGALTGPLPALLCADSKSWRATRGRVAHIGNCLY
jgi:hypothetical protein